MGGTAALRGGAVVPRTREHGDRLLWGSNWPHPIRYEDMPDDGVLVDALAEWLDDAAAPRRALVDNPACLYGFESTPVT